MVINRPLELVLMHLADLDLDELGHDGGFSFERIGGGTRITYTGRLGQRDFTSMMDTLVKRVAADHVPTYASLSCSC